MVPLYHTQTHIKSFTEVTGMLRNVRALEQKEDVGIYEQDTRIAYTCLGIVLILATLGKPALWGHIV